MFIINRKMELQRMRPCLNICRKLMLNNMIHTRKTMYKKFHLETAVIIQILHEFIFHIC